MSLNLIIRELADSEYQPVWDKMRKFTELRDDQTDDEVWLLEHHPVFTQGQAGKEEHLLDPQKIPVIQTDRGGQVTYHGPGQLMMYTLFNLKRLGLGPRQLVMRLEDTIIKLLSDYEISAEGKRDAPGVYVNDAKICSIGLRVKRHCSYHGIALNVGMDLTPFTYINPCGYQGLKMTQIKDFQPDISVKAIKSKIISYLCAEFGYTTQQNTTSPWSES